MLVSIHFPTGNSSQYTVQNNCTLSELRSIIHDNEGIPTDMQNFLALSTASSGNWESYPLTKLFKEDYNKDNDILELKVIFGPMNGGLGECDCCICAFTLCHQGNCSACLCGVGLGCVQDYSKVACTLCCLHGKCCTLL